MSPAQELQAPPGMGVRWRPHLRSSAGWRGVGAVRAALRRRRRSSMSPLATRWRTYPDRLRLASPWFRMWSTRAAASSGVAPHSATISASGGVLLFVPWDVESVGWARSALEEEGLRSEDRGGELVPR